MSLVIRIQTTDLSYRNALCVYDRSNVFTLFVVSPPVDHHMYPCALSLPRMFTTEYSLCRNWASWSDSSPSTRRAKKHSWFGLPWYCRPVAGNGKTSLLTACFNSYSSVSKKWYYSQNSQVTRHWYNNKLINQSYMDIGEDAFAAQDLEQSLASGRGRV